MEVGEKSEVIDVEVDSNEGHGVRGGKGEVGVVQLEGVYEVSDEQDPKSG